MVRPIVQNAAPVRDLRLLSLLSYTVVFYII